MKNNEALLIVDMSNDFVHDQGGLTAGQPAQAITGFIREKAEAILQAGGVVAVCMDAHQEKDEHFQLWPVHNVVGTWGQELYGELEEWYQANQTNPNLLYIPKTQYDAFYQTDLAEQLKAKGVETVIVTGVCTDICDFLTVAGAYYQGFKTAVWRAGVATFTANQDVFLDQMKLCFQTEIR